MTLYKKTHKGNEGGVRHGRPESGQGVGKDQKLKKSSQAEESKRTKRRCKSEMGRNGLNKVGRNQAEERCQNVGFGKKKCKTTLEKKKVSRRFKETDEKKKRNENCWGLPKEKRGLATCGQGQAQGSKATQGKGSGVSGSRKLGGQPQGTRPRAWRESKQARVPIFQGAGAGENRSLVNSQSPKKGGGQGGQ